MSKRPNPVHLSHAELDAAIKREMDAHPDGSPYADLLHQEVERREGALHIEVPNDYPSEGL